MNVPALSYVVGALAHLVLTILLMSRPGRSRRARWLIICSGVTLTWCVLVALQHRFEPFPFALIWTAELLRDYVWLCFLVMLISRHDGARIAAAGFDILRLSVQLLVGVLMVYVWAAPLLERWYPSLASPSQREFGQVALAIVGLFLVEQLYRDTRPDLRGRVKFLVLALGGMFAYDLYLYTDALLSGRINPSVWAARGAVTGIIVPMITISASRDPEWNLGLHVSRRMAFHSATLLASGLYLLSMGLIGYYIRVFGGAWGSVVQIVFLSAASFGLMLLLFSEQVRARIRVFLSKHFFHDAYDYREEWLSLIRTLSDSKSGPTLGERIIFAIARLVESQGGVLWVRDRQGKLVYRASYGQCADAAECLSDSDPMLTYMTTRDWIVNLTELEMLPDSYDDLRRPAWLPEGIEAWLLLPLLREETSLYGVLLLAKPAAPVRWDWEVLDFLKTASRLAASYLVLEDVGVQLTEARQFEGFNRLSAFVIHDLKNLVAQLTLVLRNAERHRNNPEFVGDAFTTLGLVVERMHRLMNHLRNASPGAAPESLDLGLLLLDVVTARNAQLPRPLLQCEGVDVQVLANRDRLFFSLEHVVQNAQDAAGKHGEVRIRLEPFDQEHIAIDVEDSGPGMKPEFIRERLFKPFDTTKGLTGMGIGAYECREYIRSLGGDVIVDSKLGHGTSFRIVVPLVRTRIMPADAAPEEEERA